MRTPEKILRDRRPTEGMADAIARFQTPHASLSMRKPSRWPTAIGLAMAVGVGAVVVRLSVPAASASPFQRIAQAERNATRCAVRFYAGDRLWGRGWQEGPKSRFDISPNDSFSFTQANDGRRYWSISSSSRVAIIVTDSGPVVSRLDSKISDYRGETKILSEKTENGAKTYVVERRFSPTSYQQRDTIVVDELDRPIEVTHRHLKKGQWILSTREVRDYESPIPPETFEFNPPKGYQSFDIDANRAGLLAGLEGGPQKSLAGISIRLVGALQDRHGMVTALYTGGATPLPDAHAWAEGSGKSVAGSAILGDALDPRAGKEPGRGAFRFPAAYVHPRPGVKIAATPFFRWKGKELHGVRFRLPKTTTGLLRLTLPVIAEGNPRTLRQNGWSIRGNGVPKGTVTFETFPIRSNSSEEIDRLPGIKRAAYEIELKKP